MSIRLRPSLRIWAFALPVALAALALFAGNRGWARPGGGLVRQEERQEAVEDVELLESYVKAKQAQVKQADQRVKLLQIYRDDAKTKHTKGYVLSTVVTEREVQLAEGETERAFRAAELKDFQVRLARAQRRLAQMPADQ